MLIKKKKKKKRIQSNMFENAVEDFAVCKLGNFRIPGLREIPKPSAVHQSDL